MSTFISRVHSNIPGIHQWNRNDFMVYSDIKELSDKNNTVKERYEKKYKTKKIGEWTIRFVFEFKEGERAGLKKIN